jgi:hypothetical protein
MSLGVLLKHTLPACCAVDATLPVRSPQTFEADQNIIASDPLLAAATVPLPLASATTRTARRSSLLPLRLKWVDMACLGMESGYDSSIQKNMDGMNTFGIMSLRDSKIQSDDV